MSDIRSVLWRVVALAVLAGGGYATWVRFTQGLGAATNLSDRHPWGVWIGFDVLCGVGLAAGGFTITTAVHILHLERLRPLVRPSVLTAFIGYLLVLCALLFDLGRPWSAWRAMVSWNYHSVMFEVAWCLILYTVVLSIEFTPALFERLRCPRAVKVIRSLLVPLVGAGFILSTLHQSSLGSLYLILPSKMHPLWYSPLLPVLFWLSAVSVGLAMVIFEAGMVARAFGQAFHHGVLEPVSRTMAFFLGLFLVVRLLDLGWRASLGPAFALSGAGSLEARMFWLEMLLTAVPPALLISQRVRGSSVAIFACSVAVVAGFVTNRLNVSVTAFEGSAGASYMPAWPELAVTASIVSAGFILSWLAYRHLPIRPGVSASPAKEASPVLVR
jgi:Ni/Fe-hydrogenase subunit HybB-like protein